MLKWFLFLLVLWWVMDRFTLRLLPNPFRVIGRWRRVGKLRRVLTQNPHDRRSRLELADLLVEQRRFRAAVEVLRSNIEAGDDDVFTLFVMGTACAGAGFYEQAEVFLGEARRVDPKFRTGQIDLELAKMRLARRDAAGARAALDELLVHRVSTVEGRFLLSQALAMLGDREGAEKARDQAWRDYVSAPGFQRRRERFWAWRVQPWRPAVYLVAVLLALFVLVRVVGPSLGSTALQTAPLGDVAPGDED
jgi:predicted Zn-dependent protease